MAITFLYKMKIPEKQKVFTLEVWHSCSLDYWQKKSVVAIFEIYLGSRIMSFYLLKTFKIAIQHIMHHHIINNLKIT